MAEVWEHREIQATCVDSDKSGSLLVLAGKRVVGVVLGDNPGEVKIKCGRASKWEVSLARWSSSPSKHHRIALASGQNFEVYNCGGGERLMLEMGVRAHPRNLTDLDWSFFDPTLLASASVDDSIHIWDLRDGRKPSSSFRALAGANQVKFCKLIDHVVATAHEGDIRIWDTRKLNGPLKYVTAHVSKIHSLDWSPEEDVSFVSCSQDGTVKLWDFGDSSRPRGLISLPSPAWKVKFSPLGKGFVTLPVPQLGSGEERVCVWQCSDLSAPVESLRREGEVVVDLAWLSISTPKPRTLFTVSRDHSLRRWNITNSLLPYGDGEDTGVFARAEEIEAVEDAGQDNTHSFQLSLQQSIQQEFSALKFDSASALQLDQMNEADGEMVVSMKKQGLAMKLKISVQKPDHTAILTLSFLQETNVPLSARSHFLKILRRSYPEDAEEKPTLTAFFSHLPFAFNALSLENIAVGSVEVNSLGRSSPTPRYHFPRPQRIYDESVPFPRTSGASFNSAGILVTFGRVELGGKKQKSTPKAMSNLFQAVRNSRNAMYTPQEITIKNYFNLPQKSKGGATKYSQLTVFNCLRLFPFSPTLASSYHLSGPSRSKVCEKNSELAAEQGRADLAKMWKLLSQTLSAQLKPSLNPDLERPWAMRPMGRALIASVLDHYAKQGDFQTVAVAACILGSPTRCPPGFFLPGSSGSSALSSSARWRKKFSNVSGSASPYNTIHSSEPLPDGWLFSLMQQRQRSSSFDEFAIGSPPSLSMLKSSNSKSAPLTEQDHHDRNTKLVDPENVAKLEKFKQHYADTLYRMGMLTESVGVMKFSDTIPAPHCGPELISVCRSCGSDSKTSLCRDCRNFALSCSVCQIAVKGLATVCPSCGHGGHSNHICSWFEKYEFCPANCGCSCVTNTKMAW